MKKKNGGFWLAFPAIAGFTVFYFVPFLITVWYSVSFGIGKREFVGMANFIDLFHNEMFLLSLKNRLLQKENRQCKLQRVLSSWKLWLNQFHLRQQCLRQNGCCHQNRIKQNRALQYPNQ